MSNALTISNTKIAVTAEQADELDQLKARIDEYDQGCRRAFGTHMGYAFLTGIALIRAKEILGHGPFIPWRKAAFPEKSDRSLGTYLALAQKIVEAHPAVGNLQNVANLKALPSGGLPEAEQRKIMEAVHDATDGKSLTELCRDLGLIRQPEKAGGARTLTFHCPECSPKVKLSGKLGANVKCPECGLLRIAKPDGLSPEEQLEADKAHAADMVNTVEGRVRLFLSAFTDEEHEDWSLRVSKADWQRLLDIGTELTARARVALGKKTKRGKGEKGRGRKGVKP